MDNIKNVNNLIVCKFGGSSVASARRFQQIKEIIKSNDQRKIIVCSAIGKEKDEDNKITDLLYLLSAHVKYHVNYDNILNLIKNRFLEIKKELNLKIDLEKEFNNITNNIKSLSEDFLISRGEYLTSLMMAEYLGYEFIDAASLIIFNYNGKVNYEETYLRISELNASKGVVIPGFYGSYPNGDIKLFSRGGSDITGAILAHGAKALVYENFTDVDGFYVTSPKIVEKPKLIKEITFEELRELSYMGASVIHEEAVLPVQECNIPLHILNTFNPNSPGTLILNEASDKENVITGIAGKKNFTAFNIVKDKYSDKLDVMSYVFKVLKNFNVNIELIPSSIDSFSVVVESEKVKKYVYDILAEIKKNEDIIDVTIDNDIALIAVVGRNMVYKPGMSAKIFSIFGKYHINVKLISQNTKEISIIIGVKNEDADQAIKAIYDELI